MSDDHSLTFKIQLSAKRATVWVTDARIMAGDYYMHEFTDEPVTVAMTLEDAREFHGWLTTVIERSGADAPGATTRTITMRCHCGRGVTVGPDPWCEGCVQSAATCDCVPVTTTAGRDG